MQRLEGHFQSCFFEPSIGAWESDQYRVYAFLDQNTIRLDIEMLDKTDGLSWDDMPQIKNDCGYQHFDAVEFYPREQDVINTGNVRHIYLYSTLLPLIRRVS